MIGKSFPCGFRSVEIIACGRAPLADVQVAAPGCGGDYNLSLSPHLPVPLVWLTHAATRFPWCRSSPRRSLAAAVAQRGSRGADRGARAGVWPRHGEFGGALRALAAVWQC